MPREGDGNDLHGKCEEDKKANEPAGAAPAGKSDVHIQRQNTKECKYCGPKTFDEVSEGGKCRFRCFMKSYAILETDESALNEDNLREATKSFVKENEKATAEAVVNSLNKCIDVSDKTKTSINRAFEIHTCSFPELKRACKTCVSRKKNMVRVVKVTDMAERMVRVKTVSLPTPRLLKIMMTMKQWLIKPIITHNKQLRFPIDNLNVKTFLYFILLMTIYSRN